MMNTNKLNIERLKEARLYRKMTMEELSNLVGINKQAVSQFESGKINPDPITLRNLASTLDFPYSFFLESEEQNVYVGNTYFRALFSSSKKDLSSQRVKAKYLARIYSVLSEKVGFRPLNLPKITHSCSIEELTRIVREHWELGDEPISNMISVLEKNGIIVGELATDGQAIDAFYQYSEIKGKPTYSIILGNDKKSFYRRQFNCAHELGHIILHESFDDFDEITRDDFRMREDQANAFAAAFLLPASSFAKDVSVFPNRLSYYTELKKKWHVSIMAMIMRAYSLDLLSGNQYTYLMRQMSARGYRTCEPLDDIVPYKHPKALRQAIDILLTKGHMSGKQVIDLFSKAAFSIPKNVVDELLGLSDDLLLKQQEESNIVYFPPQERL